MKDRAVYFKRVNQETPIMPVRLPSRDHHLQIRDAAKASGLSLSAWVRQAIGRALEEPVTTSST